ncbi:MAG: glycosyltransferase family 1 protein [Proteobacteria bacterium]|nr:MAG: glycosyltransferase family 1 protein [Pseudomonadota bacterium]
MQRLRILLLAQQNNPDWISVPLVGYQHSEALAQMHDVTLVTHFANEAAILRKKQPFKEVFAINLGIWETFYNWCFDKVFKGDHGSQILTAFRVPFYLAFESRAFARYKKALKNKEFDLVLRVTPVAPVIPSLFAARCKKLGLPFVIGPINGGLPWPTHYSQAVRQKEWISNLRFFYRYLPYARSTYRDSSAIVAGSSETYHEYDALKDRLYFIPENGIREETVVPKKARAHGAKLKLLFVGRLIPSKACDLAIKAAASLLREGRCEFTIVGDGGERKALEELSASLGVKVHFTGMLAHAEAMEYFRSADVLVFPSIREFGGGVVFEALALGCVPIVSNYGGPGDIVINGKSGFSVDLKNEDYTTQELEKILVRLAQDPDLLEEMSKEGQRYAREELSWKGKAEKMTQIFEGCLGLAKRPSFLPPR